MIKTSDLVWMSQALKLARKGLGRVHPNPLVGAVVVRAGKIVGEGYHAAFGGPHAEVNAIRQAQGDARGATLYVTLEPCAHFGKTPPCTDLIIRSGIRRVVIGRKDVNPLVAGKGMRGLKKAGIEVASGALEAECARLNRDYEYWVAHRVPYVTIKAAQSVDGKIATAAGQSQWITGTEARRFSHELRRNADAVLVGVNTILKDNPRLSVRAFKVKRQPAKIVLDSRLKTPMDAKIFSKQSPGPVFLATTDAASKQRIKAFEKKARVLVLKSKGGHVDCEQLLRELGREGIVHVLVEGGGETLASVLETQLVREAFFFVAPKIIGGRTAVGSVQGRGIRTLARAPHFRQWEARPLGDDLVIHGTF